jgi:hypothetical protein
MTIYENSRKGDYIHTYHKENSTSPKKKRGGVEKIKQKKLKNLLLNKGLQF